MANVYSDYSRARIGWFFGLSGAQLGAVAAGAVPVAWSIHRGAWGPAGLFLVGWALVAAVVITPVRGRSATGWLRRWRSPPGLWRAGPVSGPAPRPGPSRTWPILTCPGCCTGW
jgi:hypothetical protein